MARLRANFLNGLLSAALSATDTTLSSPGLAAMPVVTTGDFMPIVLDPGGLYGAQEIVHVTAHAAGATTATIVRGREGTAARAHAGPTRWAHTPLADDSSVETDSAGRVLTPRGLFAPDTRSVNNAPAFYDGTEGRSTRWEFKTAGVVGLDQAHVGSNTFVGLQTFAPWGDDSGGGVYQLAFAPQGLWYRFGDRTNGWYGWRRIQDTNWGGDVAGQSHSGINNTMHFSNADSTKSKGSGFYETPGGGGPTGSWNVVWHLRHTNRANEYGHQIAGDFFGPRVHSRELNNGTLGAWKEMAHSVRGQYSGNGVAGRHFPLGFTPKMVNIWNRDYNYWHQGWHTDGLNSPHMGWYYNPGGYQTSSDGYRPYIISDGFRVSPSVLNDSGRLYEYWAIG